MTFREKKIQNHTEWRTRHEKDLRREADTEGAAGRGHNRRFSSRPEKSWGGVSTLREKSELTGPTNLTQRTTKSTQKSGRTRFDRGKGD